MSSPEILASYRAPEAGVLADLRAGLSLRPEQRERIAARALALAAAVRAESAGSLRAEAFLQRYSLSTPEGVVLMCLAEALLRIPDSETADALIRDKLAGTRWEPGDDDGVLVNAASWGLMLTGKLAEWRDLDGAESGGGAVLRNLVARAGEPLVRGAIRHAVQIMAGQFVAGETIEDALSKARSQPSWRFSFDMLGEAARTGDDAQAYFDAYLHAIGAIGAGVAGKHGIEERAGISIKLSALHPRYEIAKRERLLEELLPRLLRLCEAAAAAQIPVTLDAEEADRLLPSLELFERLARSPSLKDWQGLGLAVQAYQKCALPVCRWVAGLASSSGRRIMVRLVKGAYWDTEIKQAQVQGASDYPVFTRKAATDVSFMACAQALLAAGPGLYAQFATHNCHSAAFIVECAGKRRDFEFQKLHGMGDALHELLARETGIACRVYAPVGSHRDLLAYLVRRLLENGANTSFVHQVADASIPLSKLAADPLDLLPEPYLPPAHIPLPRRLYPDRLNSTGLDFSDPEVLLRLEQRVTRDGALLPEIPRAADVNAVARHAAEHWRDWDGLGANARAAILERAADLIEEQREELVSLIVREAGRTLSDSAAEVREAADYCRYYAARARADFAQPLELRGPTGESNRLQLAGRGVFACISPWNFPLAIFTGQVTAALAAGNAVVAKPAEQTPRVAARAVALLHQAGVPAGVLHLAVGTGEEVGAALVSHPSVAGVAFTGSCETAKSIERALAAREGPIVPFIAETGGLNALVVDSSALPEQVVADAVLSAFNSAGQRCSSLRILLVQEEAAPRILEMLAGAMQELRVGDPGRADTDIGPVIDANAFDALEAHAAAMERAGKLLARSPPAPEAEAGHFFPPLAFELALQWLPTKEVFGPILHVVRFRQEDLEAALDALAATGYGLTLGIHSRLESFVKRVRRRLRAGNTYVNRNMIGAVVGVQPFGGEGLSGTGPKAGGPYTLHRFAVERTVTVNTAAVGGNPELFSGET